MLYKSADIIYKSQVMIKSHKYVYKMFPTNILLRYVNHRIKQIKYQNI